jgi:hypothetical protein
MPSSRDPDKVFGEIVLKDRECSKALWASDEYSAAGRTILAKYIITMGKGGERDAKWLADSAVLYLSQQKLCRKPPEVI